MLYYNLKFRSEFHLAESEGAVVPLPLFPVYTIRVGSAANPSVEAIKVCIIACFTVQPVPPAASLKSLSTVCDIVSVLCGEAGSIQRTETIS